MAGMTLNMGLGGGLASEGYAPAATPAAAGASPQGPTTIGQKAFGIVTGGSGAPRTAHIALISTGVLSLAGLLFLYWSLPR